MSAAGDDARLPDAELDALNERWLAAFKRLVALEESDEPPSYQQLQQAGMGGPWMPLKPGENAHQPATRRARRHARRMRAEWLRQNASAD